MAAIELILLGAAWAALNALLVVLSRRATAARAEVVGTLGRRATGKIRRLLFVATIGLALAVIASNAWLFARGVDARVRTLDVLRTLTVEHARSIGAALLEAAGIFLGLLIGARVIRWLLREMEHAIHDLVPFEDEHGTMPKVFAALARACVSTAWFLGIVLATRTLLPIPAPFFDSLLTAARVWAVVAFGIPVILSTDLIVVAIARLIRSYAHAQGWSRYYDQLHSLLPTLRVCLEYALWIGLLSLALTQITWLHRLAAWGPVLIEGIAIFFAGQILIQLGYLEIGHRMLPHDGLDENDRRRRATMVPLVRSAFTYAAYFGTAVLILSAMGFNPMPFLAGAGILGLVVGFGAQSMINDVVSGFFILFENIYLVGDVIDINTSSGVVEAIEFRTTKIRDTDGRLHIVRNGDMKMVVNYSKDYAIAIVALDVGYDADLRGVFTRLREAGERLRGESADVLGDTEIDGITAFGPSTMTIRTSTRVRPGCHLAVAAKLRLLIKETFDPEIAGTARKTLIPERWVPAAHAAFMMRAGKI
jgi:moderate conductance mechanosensitive channel